MIALKKIVMMVMFDRIKHKWLFLLIVLTLLLLNIWVWFVYETEIKIKRNNKLALVNRSGDSNESKI